MNSKRNMEIVKDFNKNRGFEYAKFSFDPQEKILRPGGETVALPLKTCELLAALLARHGQLLTKDELFRQVWADAFVEDANLSHHIAMLRRTLGEKTGGEKHIETVPRRSYRQRLPRGIGKKDRTIKEKERKRVCLADGICFGLCFSRR